MTRHAGDFGVGRRPIAGTREPPGVFSDNVGSQMTFFEAHSNPATELIGKAAARRSGDPSSRLRD
jgi:hypothetical protein